MSTISLIPSNRWFSRARRWSSKVIKEGKEPGQGVAYLDDGTMVIVDNAVRHQGETVEVTVTSVLQTTAGRMIFSELKEVLHDKTSFNVGSNS